MDRPDIQCGVVVHERGDQAEEVLAAFVEWLQTRPVIVGGLYQKTEVNPQGSNLMEVIDIQSGRRIPISLSLGRGSSSCCLDPAGLAEAAVALRDVRTNGVDLLVASKFAGSESAGEGLAPEIFTALAEGIPVLLLVPCRYLDKWLELSGGAGELLSCDRQSMKDWYARLALEPQGPEVTAGSI